MSDACHSDSGSAWSAALASIHGADPIGLDRALENGADPNAVASSGKHRSLLHAAVWTGQVWAVERLLQCGARPQPLSHKHLDSDRFDHPQLQALILHDHRQTRTAMWKAFFTHDPNTSASHPRENRPANRSGSTSSSTVAWTPLALLLSGVTKDPVLVPRGEEDGLIGTFRDRQLKNREIFDSMAQRPGSWTPDTAQEVFFGAVSSCHAGVLEELKTLGLSIQDIPRPTQVLNQLLLLVSMYPDQAPKGEVLTERCEGWFKELAQTRAVWDDTTVGRGSRHFAHLGYLTHLRSRFLRLQLETSLPQPSRPTHPAPRL